MLEKFKYVRMGRGTFHPVLLPHSVGKGIAVEGKRKEKEIHTFHGIIMEDFVGKYDASM